MNHRRVANGGLFTITPDVEARFWAKVERRGEKDCWFWLGHRQKAEYPGYGILEIKGMPKLAHRVSWAIANGRFPASCILHRCDTPPCVNPAHLFEGTRQDNMADKVAKGRQRAPRGVDSGVAVLNPGKVRWIRAERAKGRTIRGIAAELKVSNGTVRAVLNGTTWSHVTDTAASELGIRVPEPDEVGAL